jgi:arylsulfatase
VVFLEQQHEGLRVWQEPLVPLRAPLLFNLRSDPFEKANIESGEWEKWYVERMFVMAPAQAIVAKELQTLQAFPPRQKPGSFSVGDALDKLLNATKSSN